MYVLRAFGGVLPLSPGGTDATTVTYVLRAFGGVLAIQVSAPIPPSSQPTNVTFYLRSGAVALFVRSGDATMEVRGA